MSIPIPEARLSLPGILSLWLEKMAWLRAAGCCTLDHGVAGD